MVFGGGAPREPSSPAHLVLQLSLGAGFAVLEPVVHIGLRNGAELAELQGDLFDASFVGRVAIALLEHALQRLELLGIGIPP